MSTIILLIFSFLTSNLQEKTTFDASKFTLDGISCFQTTEEEIKNTYGEVALTETDYECGFFSVDQPGSPYFQMIYPNIKWIGNSKEGYQIDEIQFDPEGKIQLKYEDLIFSGKTTQKEIEELFSKEASSINYQDRVEKNLKQLGDLFTNSDDGFHFLFHRRVLIEFHYWSPC
jgi:hypothetical protein